MISIIIIAKNLSQITETLETLESIGYPQSHEIIVVTKDPIDSHTANQKNIRHFRFVATTTKKITIPEQRNLGVTKALGNIIVFIDASCIPAKDWLTELIKPIQEDNEYIVSGNTISSEAKNFRNKRSSSVHKYLSEAPTINLAIKKDVFDAIGYFDESFEYGSDVDFTWRAIEVGYKIRFAPKAMVTHDWGSYKEEFNRAFRYGKARVSLYKKHKHKRKLLFSKDLVTLLYPILVIILPFAIFFPILFIFYFLLLVKNYKNHPFFTLLYNFVYAIGIWKEMIFPTKTV